MQADPVQGRKATRQAVRRGRGGGEGERERKKKVW